jgi:NIMA (never in mitosis gene a)-related kinase 1/4/5
VFKVLRKEDYKVYALKLVRIAVLKPKDLQNCINEVRLLASFNSPFVIAYKEAIYD